MKTTIKQIRVLPLVLFSLFFIISCKKNDKIDTPINDAATYSFDVVVKWLDFKYRIQSGLQSCGGCRNCDWEKNS